MTKKSRRAQSPSRASRSADKGGRIGIEPRVWILAAAAVLAVLLLIRVFTRGEAPEPEPVSSVLDRPEESLLDPVLLPAEFEPQQMLLVGGTRLANLFPDVLCDIVAAVADSIDVGVLVGSAEDREAAAAALAGRGLATDAVSYLEIPVRSMWVRDFGPIGVQDEQGNLRLVDFHYRERRGNAVDDSVPVHLAELLGVPLRTSDLMIEGGDFLSNGRGLCLSSTRIAERNAYYNDLPPERVGEKLSEALGFEQWVPLPHLEGETTGHVDIYLTMVAPDVVVVGRGDPELDPANAELLDAIAAGFARIPTMLGELKVERIPMPPHDDERRRTYTNVVFANGVLLVPVYPDVCPKLDAEALAVYRRLLPDWKVVGIDSEGLVGMRGALRCVTMNLPRVTGEGATLP